MPNVIITGATGNMGQAMVKKFAGEGYAVIGLFSPRDVIPEKDNSLFADKYAVDLLSESEVEDTVGLITNKYTTIDNVVCTAGGFAMGDITNTKVSDINKQVRLNFETAYIITRLVFTQMMKQNAGRIFLVGSRPGLSAKRSTGTIGYGLSKSLLFRLAEILNEEAKGKNVVTGVIVPGTIDTKQNRESMPEADFSTWVTPEEIADAVFFYCTRKAASLREPVLKLYKGV